MGTRMVSTGGLDNKCPVGVRWPGYMCPSGGNRRVIWRCGVCPGNDTELESAKVKVPRLVRTREGPFPNALTFTRLIIVATCLK